MCLRKNHFLLFLLVAALGTSLHGKSAQTTATDILKQLYYSIGNFQQPMPSIEVVNSEELVAAYIPNKNIIYLEEKAFDVCRSFEKDSLSALAFLIGHELTHCYQKVGWASNFLAYDKVANGVESEEKAADV